ncbi:hypothetical protein SDC9_172436 [bioreactor metagenome]|uniref:Uncharacterized protein n=1 Tax=bioreactor metagenome TaxID=1076179 RepID=A0A645GGW0_9ZZZZ
MHDGKLIFNVQQFVRYRQGDFHGVAVLRLGFGVGPLDIQGDIEWVNLVSRSETEVGGVLFRVRDLDFNGA